MSSWFLGLFWELSLWIWTKKGKLHHLQLNAVLLELVKEIGIIDILKCLIVAFFPYFCSDVCQFPRSWLLPVMRDNVCETEMMYFFEKLLPLANRLHLKGTSPLLNVIYCCLNFGSCKKFKRKSTKIFLISNFYSYLWFYVSSNFRRTT